MPVNKTVALSARRQFHVSAEAPDGAWWMRFLTRDDDGSWRVDPSPGLRLPWTDLPGFRDFLLTTLREVNCSPPQQTLVDVAESYRDAAETGDPAALVIVRVVEAMHIALRDGDEEADELLTVADAYLQRKRSKVMPLGGGDPRIKRPGRAPEAARRLLRIAQPIAARRTAPLEAVQRARGLGDDFDVYAERLAEAIQTLFPRLCPANRRERKEQRTDALAEKLRKMNNPTQEGVVRAALRAFKMHKDEVRNFFSYLQKKK